ncbi:hypothetical protein HX127_08340 [Acinetobacter sp. 256-1]|uniref:hypothetical protein n=1 Tax=Acinetobacter sp. 256-1 TaxID=2746721 RepID=UPI002575F322|nr:hypothetical protein [Acinetobacter sp. 256-1]MDM1757580.1 hypothetical protein [Acinetobacter sp. 256-1]
MDIFWIVVITFMLCIYIAITVGRILQNQIRLNDARCEQVKKLSDEIKKLQSEVRKLEKDNC